MAIKSIKIIEKMKEIFLNPSNFFKRVKKERGIGEAFKYVAIISLVEPIIITLIGLIFNKNFLISTEFLTVASYIIKYALSLILTFIFAGILHLSVKILKGKNGYPETYKVLVYSSTPFLLLAWLSLDWIKLILLVYSTYLSVKGISKLHNVDTGRAFLMVVLPSIIVFVILLLLVFIFLSKNLIRIGTFL